MAEIKSRETLFAELKTFIRAYNRNLDTGDNSLAKDLLLLPYAVGGKVIMDQVEIARDLQLLSKLDTGDLDNEGTNFQKERLTGSYAIVILTFYSEVAPAADIIIPAGTQGQTAGTSFASPVSFSTISEARYTIAVAAPHFSYDRARYEFEVMAICDTIGTVGNIGSNTVTTSLSSITGIEGVTNLTAAAGGLDQESNDDYRERIQLANTGRDLNTVNGLRLFLRDVGFLAAYPVRVENADSERATGIDGFVINQSSETVTEVFTYDPSQERYYLTNRPVLEVTSVVGSNAGTLGAADYDANIDNTSPMRRSIYAMDYISFRITAALLVGEQITVTYNYAPLVKNTQDTLNLNENDVLTADPLIKRGLPMYFYITASLTLKANADGAATRNKVRNALAQFLAGYRLSDDIQKSDIVVVMQEGYGDYPIDMVDAVVISSYYLQDENGNRRQPVDEVISVGDKEYVVFGQATIT